MTSRERESAHAPTREQSYAELTLKWARQARVFAQSLRAYQARSRIRARRLALRSAQLGFRSDLRHPEDRPLPLEIVPAQVVSVPEAASPTVPVPESTAPLTRRQFEVARLIARGLSNEEIARDLVLTPGTVGNHVGHILRRLQAKNRAQVAAWVTQVVSREGGNGSLVS